MKRVAIIADSHWDEHSRWDECRDLHDWIADNIAGRGVDMVIHTGDVFERKSTPKERNAVAAWLRRVARSAPVLIVRGNHDVVGDLAIFASLEAKHPIEVVETYGVRYQNGVNVAALAWPRKAHILASTNCGHEASEQIAADALRDVIRGMGSEMAERAGPKILAAHAMVTGSVTSVGQPLVGCDLEVGLSDLSLAGADMVALGHIHKGQDWTFGKTPIVYPGSPRRTAFGELEQKGYVLATFADDNACTWERIVVPATEMILVNAKWWPSAPGGACFGFECEDDLGELPCLNDRLEVGEFARAEVRLRYTVDADHRDAAKREAGEIYARLRAAGAVSVKVEEQVVATARSRVPEIAQAKTLPDQLAAMWSARRDVPEAGRAARLLSKLVALETEVGT